MKYFKSSHITYNNVIEFKYEMTLLNKIRLITLRAFQPIFKIIGYVYGSEKIKHIKHILLGAVVVCDGCGFNSGE